ARGATWREGRPELDELCREPVARFIRCGGPCQPRRGPHGRRVEHAVTMGTQRGCRLGAAWREGRLGVGELRGASAARFICCGGAAPTSPWPAWAQGGARGDHGDAA